MPTSTYDLIASNVLTGTATSVTFSSIPATYRDLILVIRASTSSLSYLTYRLNGDTGANYLTVYAEGTGSLAQSSTVIDSFGYFVPGDAGRSNTGSATLTIANFQDYSATNKHKTQLVRANNTTTGTSMSASRWASTSAINSIVVAPTGAANFEVGGTFYLYGLVS